MAQGTRPTLSLGPPSGPDQTPRAGSGTARPGRRRGSASGERASRRRRRGGAPPRGHVQGRRRRSSERWLGNRPASMSTTATWSNSRPFVEWAVASVSRASPRRSRARSARRARIARRRRGVVVERRRPGKEGPRPARRRTSASCRRVRPHRQRRCRGDRPHRCDPDEQRTVTRRSRRARRGSSSSRGSSSGSSSRSARNGIPSSSATAAAGSSSRFVRARIARVDARRHRPPRPTKLARTCRARSSSSAASGASTSRPTAAGRATIRLANRSSLCSTSRTARSTTGRRAAEVRDQVVRRRPGSRSARSQDPSDVGQPPAVDRLVVVADEEDPVGRRGDQERQLELGSVDVLDLVDQQLAAGRAPAGQLDRVGLGACSSGACDEVVEVESATLGQRPLVADEGSGAPSRVGSSAITSAVTRCSSLSAEKIVSSWRRSPGSAHGATARRSESRSTSGSTGRPAARRISRPKAWKVRTRTVPGRTPSGASAASTRSTSSSAARLLKAIAAIAAAGVPVATSQAIRATSVVVLPLPAGARQSTGPGGAVAAARWSVSVARAERERRAGDPSRQSAREPSPDDRRRGPARSGVLLGHRPSVVASP